MTRSPTESNGATRRPRGDDLHQQAGAVALRYEHVGDDRAADPARELLRRCDGEDAPKRASCRGAEMLASSRFGQGA